MQDLEINSILDKLVLECYMEYMKYNDPLVTTQKIRDMAQYVMEVKCYDLIYPEVSALAISSDSVHDILGRYKYIHRHRGDTYYDCQNVINDDWHLYQRIKKDGD